MQLKRNETLVGMSILSASATSAAAAEGAASPTVLLVTAQGLGKRVPAEAFPLQRRAGMGNIAIKCNPGDRLVALHVVCALACFLPSCHVLLECRTEAPAPPLSSPTASGLPGAACALVMSHHAVVSVYASGQSPMWGCCICHWPGGLLLFDSASTLE